MSDDPRPRRVFAVKALIERKRFPSGTGATRAILAALAWFADDDGTGAWPSHTTLAERTAYSRASVIASMKESVARGWVRVIGKRVIGVRTTVSDYAFDLAAIRTLPDLKEPVTASHTNTVKSTVSDADTVRAATVSANGAHGVSDRGFTVSDADTKVRTTFQGKTLKAPRKKVVVVVARARATTTTTKFFLWEKSGSRPRRTPPSRRRGDRA